MINLSKFDDIRPYTDQESIAIYNEICSHPAVYSVMKVMNPYLKKEEVVDMIKAFKTVDDFQRKFSYPGLKHIIDKTSDGLTYQGIDELDKDTSYLFISNHRDIMLDTSLLSLIMLEKGMKTPEAAIGDNLVTRDLLSKFSKLNRNFLVKRSASGREMLLNSKHLSEYIQFVIHNKDRSVWIAQKEGRTKDGLDETNPGLLKMLAMAAPRKGDVVDYLKKTKIVPLSISYEYDPNDRFKIDELIAKEQDTPYLKDRNEDFRQIITGMIGQKQRINIKASKPLDEELDELYDYSGNKLFQRLAEIIDSKIIGNYKLWPSNFLAYDLSNKTNKFSDKYSDINKKMFLRRIEKRAVQHKHNDAEKKFLEMYANPVENLLKIDDIK